jgi:hypothetical protein
MRTLFRLPVCAALLGALGAGLYWARPDQWPDWTRDAEALATLEQEGRRAEALEVRQRDVLCRLRAIDRVLDDLTDGRQTLLEAAARMRAIDAAMPPAYASLIPVYPGNTAAERACRRVIALTKVRLSHRPAQAAKVLARLEAELQKHREHPESFLLPEFRAD